MLLIEPEPGFVVCTCLQGFAAATFGRGIRLGGTVVIEAQGECLDTLIPQALTTFIEMARQRREWPDGVTPNAIFSFSMEVDPFTQPVRVKLIGECAHLPALIRGTNRRQKHGHQTHRPPYYQEAPQPQGTTQHR